MPDEEAIEYPEPETEGEDMEDMEELGEMEGEEAPPGEISFSVPESGETPDKEASGVREVASQVLSGRSDGPVGNATRLQKLVERQGRTIDRLETRLKESEQQFANAVETLRVVTSQAEGPNPKRPIHIPSMLAEQDKRPWEFAPKGVPISGGGEAPRLCKHFIPYVGHDKHICLRSRVCKNARKLRRGGCAGGIEGVVGA